MKIKSGIVVERKENTQEIPTVDTFPEQEDAGKNVLLLAEDDKDMREYLMNSLSSEYKVIRCPMAGRLWRWQGDQSGYHYFGYCHARVRR